MNIPVIFIIFNRPEKTRVVFDVIKKAKPKKLIVISDGPRNSEDADKCEASRNIINEVDWDCEVLKRYSKTNLGCRINISTGLTWAFNQVDRAIVLEDDCFPDISFFSFCEELLEKYKDNDRVMHISGNFFQQRNPKFLTPGVQDSYYFSQLPHIWGWATWSRAWKHYDADLKNWPEVKESGLMKTKLKNPAVYEYWETIWDQYYDNKIDSWDGQWAFSCILNDCISINPTKNIVKNIGFGHEALHTKNTESFFAKVPLEKIDLPLIHPTIIEINQIADNFTWRQSFGINAKLSQRVLGPIRRQFPVGYSAIRSLFKKLFRK